MAATTPKHTKMIVPNTRPPYLVILVIELLVIYLYGSGDFLDFLLLFNKSC